MMQLLNEFNQDKIKKIAAAFAASVENGIYDAKYEYEADADWIKAAVMHMDHLRQNKQHLSRMHFIVRSSFATAAPRKFFMQGEWNRISYANFLAVVNSFEPSMQMRHIQHQHENQPADDRPLHQEPVIVQNDAHFLVMRAETPKAAIEAMKHIETATKKQYSWCISSKTNNLFYRYRTENKASPVTVYFVWNKTKSVDDAWHAFVVHIGKYTMMLTNAQNVNPKIIASHETSEHLQGIDASNLIVQSLTKSEQSHINGTNHMTNFNQLSYDDRTKRIEQRTKLRMDEYARLDKNQQHLYVHYLNPNKPNNLWDAFQSIGDVFTPTLYSWATGIEILHHTQENSIAQLFDANEPYIEFLKYTWSKETKDYYYMIAQRTINNAAALIMQDYI